MSTHVTATQTLSDWITSVRALEESNSSFRFDPSADPLKALIQNSKVPQTRDDVLQFVQINTNCISDLKGAPPPLLLAELQLITAGEFDPSPWKHSGGCRGAAGPTPLLRLSSAPPPLIS